MISRELEDAVLKLERRDRAALAKKLLESLDEPLELEIEQLWAGVASRRMDEIRNGAADSIPGPEAFRRVYAVVSDQLH